MYVCMRVMCVMCMYVCMYDMLYYVCTHVNMRGMHLRYVCVCGMYV